MSLGAGNVVIESAKSASHTLVSVEPLNSPSSLKTSPGASASVILEGVGTVRIGPATTTKVTSSVNGMTFALTEGALCIQSQAPSLAVWVGEVQVTPSSPSAIFDIRGDPTNLTLAVFQGSVIVRHAAQTLAQSAGSAFAIGSDGTNGQQLLLRPTVLTDFASLDCPDQQVIAAAEAAATASNPPSGGHGSGGVIGALLGLAAVAVAFAGHGGGGSGSTSSSQPTSPPPPTPSPPPTQAPTPTPTPTPTPGPLVVSTNSIALVGAGVTKTFTASESNYTGVLNAASSNTAAASVSGSGNGPGPVTFTATAVAPGNANITVSDDHAGQQVIFTSVTTGTMTVDPQTLSFSGPHGQMKFTATDSAADIKTLYFAASSDPTVATVSPTTQRGDEPVKFTVTPINTGMAAITVHDLNGTAVVSVGVGVPPLQRAIALRPRPNQPTTGVPQAPPGKNAPPTAPSRLALSAANLTIAGPGRTQMLTVSELGYSGPITATVVGPAVVDIDHPSGRGPVQIFKLTSRTVGTTTVRIHDDHGNSEVVSITTMSAVPAPSLIRQPVPTLPPPSPRPPRPLPVPKPRL